MAQIFNEQKFINDTIFKYEEKLNSPAIRFLDHTPTFTTYWHVNNNESTTNEGTLDVEHIIGKRSPLRFQKIENFPLYGLEAVLPQIQDNEFGLDTVFESEAVILPNSLKPLSNDFFIINHLQFPALFRVIDIEYDNMRADNFYKIHFKLDAIDEDKIDLLNEQINENYECVLENIGTENQCIISSSYKTQLDKVHSMYDDIADTYANIFYNSRHNCMLGDMSNGLSLYDPFQTEFITKHNLFNKKRQMNSIILTDQLEDSKKQIKYERSIYRFIERRDPVLVNPFRYLTFLGMNNSRTSFARWYDKSIWVVDIPPVIDEFNSYKLLDEEVINNFSEILETDSDYLTLIKKFMNKEKVTIFDIPLTLHEELLKLDANLEVFFFTPIILYIIDLIIKEFHQTGLVTE